MKVSSLSAVVVASLLSFSLVASAASVRRSNNDAQNFSTSMRLNEDKTVGLNFEPLWLAVGGIGVKADYFMTDKLSLTGRAMVVPKRAVTPQDTNETQGAVPPTYNQEYSEYMLGTTYMLTGTQATDGFYINPALGFLSSKISDYSAFKLSGELSGFMARATAGYQWIFSKSVRLAAGAGGLLMGNGKIIVKDNAGNEVLTSDAGPGFALDLQIGYLF